MWVRDGREMYLEAYRRGYAIPAFNIASLEMAQGCLRAAEGLRAPVILQTYREEVRRVSPRVFAAMVRAMAEEATVPVLLHLDHGAEWAELFAAIAAGYGSVMWDAEGQGWGVLEGIRVHAPVVHAMGAALEVAVDAFAGEAASDPALVREVVQAGADVVAVAVGSRHGAESRLDLGLLARIAEEAKAPLALHGGSGIHPEDLREALAMGVVKVNVGTALYRSLRSLLGQAYEHHRVFYRKVEEEMEKVARGYIRRLQAEGKA